MHRKSLEAAETLKNSDDGGSDREENKTEESDASVTSNTSKTPQSPKLHHNNNNNNNSSITVPAVAISPHNQDSQHSSNVSIGSSPPPSQPQLPPAPNHNQLPSHLQQSTTHLEHLQKNPNTSPSSNNGPSYTNLSDTDPEVFRWVDYNREYPMSFIR